VNRESRQVGMALTTQVSPAPHEAITVLLLVTCRARCSTHDFALALKSKFSFWATLLNTDRTRAV